MSLTRCGDCRWYEPTRNPDTGRVLTSAAGRCTYLIVWPVLPKAMISAWNSAYLPSRLLVSRDDERPCAVFQAKAKPAVKRPARTLEDEITERLAASGGGNLD